MGKLEVLSCSNSCHLAARAITSYSFFSLGHVSFWICGKWDRPPRGCLTELAVDDADLIELARVSLEVIESLSDGVVTTEADPAMIFPVSTSLFFIARSR